MFNIHEVRLPVDKEYKTIRRFIRSFDVTKTEDECDKYIHDLKLIKDNKTVSYTRRIFFLRFQYQVVGLLIVSKDLINPCIEFIAVEKAYRKFGGGTDLFETAFKILKTDQPSIEIPLDSYFDFKNFITRYEWYTTMFYNKNDNKIFVMNKF